MEEAGEEGAEDLMGLKLKRVRRSHRLGGPKGYKYVMYRTRSVRPLGSRKPWVERVGFRVEPKETAE